jgi:hypothetical protein
MAEIETEIQTLTAELDSDCSCEDYDEDTDTSKPSESCFGDCWTESKDDFTEHLLKPYLVVKGWEMDTPIKVASSRMTWQGIMGWAYTTPERLVDTLTLNGDFRLVFEFDGHDLTAIRYSHDEPMGTGKFVIELSDEQDDY